jgi:hypothetical protein
VQNSKHRNWKKELLDVMQAWHGLSKYNSATAVSISFYAQSQKKKISKSKKKYYQDRNHKCIKVRWLATTVYRLAANLTQIYYSTSTRTTFHTTISSTRWPSMLKNYPKLP